MDLIISLEQCMWALPSISLSGLFSTRMEEDLFKIIYWDRGTTFRSRTISKMHELLRTKLFRTNIYHLQMGRLVNCFNQVKILIGCLCTMMDGIGVSGSNPYYLQYKRFHKSSWGSPCWSW